MSSPTTPTPPLNRRRLIRGSAALGGLSLMGLGGCATGPLARPSAASGAVPPLASFDRTPSLALVRAERQRVFDITVCLRPFRAQGPRLDTETVGDKLVVHNYGHGGSGWSLSWGSSTIAVQKAMAASPREIAVIGCGALGLTSALLAQQAGAKVTIYARDRLPRTRSARATGTWSPDSRIALADKVAPDFPALWEQMARTAFKTYRSYLGLPGSPVEWSDRYYLSDLSPEERRRRRTPQALSFADYEDRIADLDPPALDLPPGESPFPVAYARRAAALQFNIADYGHTLMSDFLLAGGTMETVEFHSPADLARLKETVVINCPGYGARALWKDETIIPVRGQIAWLVPQPEVNYGLVYRNVSILSRRDGIVVQAVEGGDMKGYGDDNETPDLAEADRAVATMAALFGRMRPGGRG